MKPLEKNRRTGPLGAGGRMRKSAARQERKVFCPAQIRRTGAAKMASKGTAGGKEKRLFAGPAVGPELSAALKLGVTPLAQNLVNADSDRVGKV